MIAFEVLMNGKRLYTIGAGDFGTLHASARWMRIYTDDGFLMEFANFIGASMAGPEGPVRTWPAEKLNIGDEITVRMIETDSIDPPDTSEQPPSQIPPWQPHHHRFSN